MLLDSQKANATSLLEGSGKQFVKGHLFSTYAKFSEKLLFRTPRYAHVRMHIRG